MFLQWPQQTSLDVELWKVASWEFLLYYSWRLWLAWARWSGHQSRDKTVAPPQTTMFTHKICISLKQNMIFFYITICMYDGYGPNRMLTKCLIHKRLFVLYIFSILKLNTFSIGHGWGNIITINRYTCCLLSWEGHWLGLVCARRSGTRGRRSRAGPGPRSRPSCWAPSPPAAAARRPPLSRSAGPAVELSTKLRGISRYWEPPPPPPHPCLLRACTNFRWTCCVENARLVSNIVKTLTMQMGDLEESDNQFYLFGSFREAPCSPPCRRPRWA